MTIIPRGNGALGFAQYLPKEISLRTKDQLLDLVCMALAGRAAEQVFFGRVTTGAANDLERVTQIVYQMVQVYGMNATIGQVAFPKRDGGWPSERQYRYVIFSLLSLLRISSFHTHLYLVPPLSPYDSFSPILPSLFRSESTAERMDAEVKLMVDEAYARTLALMVRRPCQAMGAIVAVTTHYLSDFCFSG